MTSLDGMESLIKRHACTYWRPRLLLHDLGLRLEVRFLDRRRVLLHDEGAGRTTDILVGDWLPEDASSFSELGFRIAGIQMLHIAATDEIVVLSDVDQDDEHVRLDGLGVEGRHIISKPCERLLSDRGVDFAKTQVETPVIQW